MTLFHVPIGQGCVPSPGYPVVPQLFTPPRGRVRTQNVSRLQFILAELSADQVAQRLGFSFVIQESSRSPE
jgi:hypothetical protein